MGKFKMKGFKAFDMEKNSNNRPDGRAGSSVFQIAGKVYNKFSTSPNKIGKKSVRRKNIGLSEEDARNIGLQGKRQMDRPPQTVTRKSIKTDVDPQSQGGTGKMKSRVVPKVGEITSPMDIATRSVGSSNRLKTRPVRRRKDSSDPFKVANQYRRVTTGKDEQRDAKARMMKVRRENPDASPKEQAMLANTAKYRGYTAKDEYKRFKETGGFGSIIGGRQTAKADSPNKISKVITKAPKIAKAIGKTIAGTVGKMAGNKGTNYKDIMKKNNAYNIKEHQVKQPGGGMGTVITYQIKGQKGEFSISKNRLLENISKGKK
tara:strand:+ start:217 stop:1170 length:954 start_codon:yes stop_codon:yes gene_type:complete